MKMKKLGLLLVGALFATSLFAQATKQPEIEAKEELKAPVSEEMASIQAAFQLAEYGYKNGSASSLLCAAEILAQIPKQEMKTKAKKDTAGTSDSTPDKKQYTAEQLLTDGRKLAGKDKTLLAYAKNVEKLVKAGTRGAFGGPGYDYDIVYGSDTATYNNIGFVAGRYAEISVYSDNGADLDLYVYDENWNLIDKDTSYSTSAYCSFVPLWDGNFQIVIKNNSRYASWYEMYTN